MGRIDGQMMSENDFPSEGEDHWYVVVLIGCGY